MNCSNYLSGAHCLQFLLFPMMYIKMSVPYRLFYPDTTRLSRHFQKWERFLPWNFERSSRKFRALIHSVQALSNHIAAKFLRKRNSLRGIPAAYLNVLSLIQPLHLLQVQSAPDNSNLQGKSKIVRVIGISSYREFEANKRK